jgi:hypothetical protein
MGCRFVMAIDDFYRSNGTYTSCDGEPAAAPGLYPQPDGSTSTFRQRFTGTWGGAVHTIGNTVTPSAPAFWPKTSNCVTYSTIANGVDPANLMVTAAPTLLVGSASTTVVSVPTTTMATTTKVTGYTPPPPSTAPTASGSAAADGTAVTVTNSDGSVETSMAPAQTKPNGASMATPAAIAVLGAVFGAAALF